MENTEKKSFARQMYTADSEVGRMKLQSVKENLYEATTKAVLYSIEMYTKMTLQEWAQTSLSQKWDNLNNDLKREKDEWELGHIGMFDITNGCAVINGFIREDALALSRKELTAKISLQEAKIAELKEKEGIIEKRKLVIEAGENEEEEDKPDESEEVIDFIDEENDSDYNSLEKLQGEDSKDYYEDFEDDNEEEEYDEDEEIKPIPLSEIDLFKNKIALIKDLEEIENVSEELYEEKAVVENFKRELMSLQKDRKNILGIQFGSEKESLENLRTLRNTVFAHKSEDQQKISKIGSWEPEAGPLYLWATEILKYIKIIESRYRIYSLFDDFYASKEGKDKFDSCKVYVQKQIKELYVNRSSVVFEFAGELYDKEDEEFNFKKLIENMAISWNTGIRYLTVVTNDDLPELNIFFKECLSGTNKYVDYYLVDRNALRESIKKKDSTDAHYLYFRLLYHLNPSMELIYWMDRAYTKKEFAQKVLYKFIKVKNMFHLDARLEDFEKYSDGINVIKWCEYHLLSEIYFMGIDDPVGQELALDMENAIIEFCRYGQNKGRQPLYRKAIKASVKLYFYMGGDYVFSYTRSNGQTFHWRSLEDARSYVESAERFESYTELKGFINDLYKSDYFKIWRNQLLNKDSEE